MCGTERLAGWRLVALTLVLYALFRAAGWLCPDVLESCRLSGDVVEAAQIATTVGFPLFLFFACLIATLEWRARRDFEGAGPAWLADRHAVVTWFVHQGMRAIALGGFGLVGNVLTSKFFSAGPVRNVASLVTSAATAVGAVGFAWCSVVVLAVLWARWSEDRAHAHHG